jgi:hypothetical protein
MQFSVRLTTILFFTLLLLCTVASAEVFKHIDAKGNITYTDVSTKKNEKPHKVPPAAMTYKSTTAPTSNPNTENSDENTAENTSESDAAEYISLIISSPENNSVIRANGGSFELQLTSDPNLDTSANDQFSIILDGQQHQLSTSNAVVLSNVERGPHTLQAQILNGENVLVESETINIQILRTSIQNRNPNINRRRP